MGHTQESLINVAAMLVVRFGFEFNGYWVEGHEAGYLSFTDLNKPAPNVYSVEFGGEDTGFEVAVYLSHKTPERDMEDWRARDHQDPPPESPPCIWELQYSDGLDPEDMVTPVEGSDYEPALFTFVVGAIATFLYDLREGRVNGVN